MLKFSSCCEIIVKMLNSKELWTTKKLHFPNNSDFITFYEITHLKSSTLTGTKALLHTMLSQPCVQFQYLTCTLTSTLLSVIVQPQKHSGAVTHSHIPAYWEHLQSFIKIQYSSRAARCEADDLMISSEQHQRLCWFRCWLKGQCSCSKWGQHQTLESSDSMWSQQPRKLFRAAISKK